MAGKRVKKAPFFSNGGINQDNFISDPLIYERFFNRSSNFFCIMGRDGYLNLVNPAFQQHLGYPLKELYSKPFLDFVHPEDRNMTRRGIMQYNDGGYSISCRNRFKCKDGSYRFLGWIFRTDDNEGQTYMTAHDITERINLEEQIHKINLDLDQRIKERTNDLNKANQSLKSEITRYIELEKTLRKNERRFYTAAQSTSDLIWEGDTRKNSLHWFGDIDKLLGYDLGEFPRTIEGYLLQVHQEDRRTLEQKIRKAVKTGDRFHAVYRIKCKDGSYRYWDERGKPLEFENKKAVKWVGAITDITDLKKAEDELRESKNDYKRLSREFRTLLDAIPDNILLLDKDVKIIWANRTAALRFNKNVEALTDQHCYKLCCGIFSPCNNCPTIKSFLTGREETSTFKSPSGLVWDIRSFPIKDEFGQVKNIIELARDITVKVQMEEDAKALQLRLLQANKMTSLGTFVSGIIHEINNPNSFIMSNSQLIKKTWKDNRKILEEHFRKKGDFKFGGLPYSEMRGIMPKVIDGIDEGAVRIHKIISGLRDFVRQEKTSSHGKVNVNKAVRKAQIMLDHQIKKYTSSFQTTFGNNIPLARGTSQQIEQVIINLIMNSLQALTNKKQGVRVSTRFDRKSRTAVIQVRDEGSGIPEDMINRIIEPFFTTKLKSGGTGLGLSISYNIVKDCNGVLEFKSEQGKGTTATVRLPVETDKS